MRQLVLSAALALLVVPSMALSAPPAATGNDVASKADVTRLLEVMDMKTMMAGMMQQMGAAQSEMVVAGFGEKLSDADRAKMQDVLAQTNAIVQKHMEWSAVEPVVAKVYAQVFTRGEIQAMTRFYSSPEGVSILKKSPQAMALTMQEIQPISVAAMAEVKALLDKETAASKGK